MSAMDVFWAAPPVTRTITAATVTISLLVYTGFLDGRLIIFWWPWVFKIMPQLWRLFSSFLLTGPKLGIIMDPYFLYTYGSSLETESPRLSQPGDFFTYVAFLWAVILFTNGFLLSGFVFLQSLLLGFAYTYAQENPTRQVTFFIITFQVKWLPYAMLAMTFVMDSPTAALHQATGLFAAHLYEFLTRIWPEHGGGRNIIQTPGFILRWFGADAPDPRARGYGTAFAARPQGQESTSTTGGGQSSGMGLGSASQAWARRGPGHRLGGD